MVEDEGSWVQSSISLEFWEIEDFFILGGFYFWVMSKVL
jgi:hypothetical protein